MLKLALIQGVPPILSDANSNETYETLNLLDPAGLTIEAEDGWVPQVAQSAPQYAANNRALVAAPIGNVSETLRIVLKAGSAESRALYLNRLNQFARAAEDFWVDFTVRPVSLMWRAPGADLPQYSLILSINMSMTGNVTDLDDIVECSTEIVREAFWTPYPFGSTPQAWTRQVNAQTLDTANAVLTVVSGTARHIADKDVHFNTLWNGSSYVYQGYMDIPANSIPGDLPAPVQIAMRLDTAPASQGSANTHPAAVMICRYTGPTSIRLGGITYEPLHTLPASIMTLGTDASVVADSTSVGGNAASISFTTATLQDRLSIQTGAINVTGARATLVPGTYQVFARVAPQAITSVFDLQLVLGWGSSPVISNFITGAQVRVPAFVTGDSFSWFHVNLGTFTIPRQRTGLDGSGLETTDYRILLRASRTGGGAALRISDLTFMPLDEAAVLLDGTQDYQLATTTNFVYDATGYLSREPGADAFAVTPGSAQINFTPRGGQMTLLPGRANRLYFYWYAKRSVLVSGQPTAYTTVSGTVADVQVGLNLQPRWLGIRAAP